MENIILLYKNNPIEILDINVNDDGNLTIDYKLSDQIDDDKDEVEDYISNFVMDAIKKGTERFNDSDNKKL